LFHRTGANEEHITALLGGASCALTQSLMILDAAVSLADAHVVESMLSCFTVGACIHAALGSLDDRQRGRGLSTIGRLLLKAPVALCGQLCPLLTTATLVDVPPLRALALAILGDAAFALAHARGSDRHSTVAAEQLSASLKLFAVCLYSPAIEMQHISALSLSRLVLRVAGALEQDVPSPRARADCDADCDADSLDGVSDAPDASLDDGCVIHSTVDLESLIADLAFRYTAQSTQLDALPKAAAAHHRALMASILACFEALVAANRTAELSNTVVWVLLGAAENGHLESLRFASPLQSSGEQTDEALEPRTLRCVRFLTSLVVEQEWPTPQARCDVARSLVEAARINLKLEHALDVSREQLALWLMAS
jgi:hypothetical protein